MSPVVENVSPLMVKAANTENLLKPIKASSMSSTDVSDCGSPSSMSPRSHKIHEKSIRARDKRLFTLNVINLVVCSALITHDAKYFAFWNSFFMTVLLIHRFIEFFQLRWQFYLVDFCYFINLLVIAFTVFFPHNEFLFKASFIFSFGPLMFVVYFLRNSLAFHSMEKVTSFFMHSSPGLTMFLIHWKDESKYFVSSNNGIEQFGWDFLSNWYSTAAIVYFSWVALYVFIVWGVCKNYIKEKNFDTLYSYAFLNPKLKKEFLFLGEKWAPFMYFVVHCRNIAGLTLVSLVAYHNFWFGLIWMVVIQVIGINNGASYYIHYHSSKYEKQFLENTKELDT